MSWSVLTPILLVTGALVIIALERLKPYDKGEKFLREGFWTDFVMYGVVQSYVMGVVISALVHWVDERTGSSTYGVVSGWPIWLQVVFFVVLHDFYIYWFHRAQHNNRFLWRLHEAHHSAKHVDWCAGLRSHSIEILINQSIEVGAMILLGAHPDVILIKVVISGVWGMWIHCNVDVHSGPLQYVINGPEMHRWHHAIDYPDEGSNYGTKFAFWDYLFGTVYRPPRKPAGYGLAEPFPRGWLRQHVYAFRRFQ
jgi:sterol desaturase/sphingolipid hydroxylase (fatty acid hydroxylase superfamily)